MHKHLQPQRACPRKQNHDAELRAKRPTDAATPASDSARRWAHGLHRTDRLRTLRTALLTAACALLLTLAPCAGFGASNALCNDNDAYIRDHYGPQGITSCKVKGHCHAGRSPCRPRPWTEARGLCSSNTRGGAGAVGSSARLQLPSPQVAASLGVCGNKKFKAIVEENCPVTCVWLGNSSLDV